MSGEQDEQRWETVPQHCKSGRRRRNEKPKSTAEQEGSFGGSTTVAATANISMSILLLMGLQGSGKSTLAEALCRASQKYVRVNQDALGSREKCIKLADRTLQSGKSPIIDRCNISAEQRQHWTSLAGSYGASVDCVVLEVAPEVCMRRCQTRDNHPTLPPRQARGIIRATKKQWETPNAEQEGFRSVTIVSSNSRLEETVARLLIL